MAKQRQMRHEQGISLCLGFSCASFNSNAHLILSAQSAANTCALESYSLSSNSCVDAPQEAPGPVLCNLFPR